VPLTDFVRYLNAQLPNPASALRAGVRFLSESGRVFVYYADLRLASEFSPVIDTASGELRGHCARLRVTRKRDGKPLDAATLFALPEDDRDLIFVDRLVRTLHTLNYLTYGERRAQHLLLLKVHPRHVASVAADHGLAFEEILRACGLLPQNVVLELEIASVQAGAANDLAADPAHWLRAAANYQSRGYAVAVKRFSGSAADFALVELVRPALVRVDARLAAEPEALSRALGRLRALGCQVLGEGAGNESARAAAWQSGLHLLQQCLPKHAASASAETPAGSSAAAPWSAAA
jgi:EAL domain-containing protein (putative c-di-GMP-specific phosphodiesterase class I)